MAQRKGFPETLLKGNEEFYIRDKLMKQGPGKLSQGKRCSPLPSFFGAQKVTRPTYHDPRVEWPKYCAHIVRMAELPCGHYPTEQAPEETYQELSKFLLLLTGSRNLQTHNLQAHNLQTHLRHHFFKMRQIRCLMTGHLGQVIVTSQAHGLGVKG